MSRIDYDGDIATVYDRGRAIPLDGLTAWRTALAHYLPPESGLPVLDVGAGTGLFAVDKDNVLACDVFLFVLDGRVPDEGACVELGIAYCQKELRQPTKRLLGLQTDVRVAFPSGALNTMVGVPLERVVHTEDALLELLQQIRAT